MLQIRPVSDLRNKFTDIEKELSNGEPIILTKNGYSSMVVMSVDAYDKLTSIDIEEALDAADYDAKNNPTRYTHEEVFGSIRNKIKNKHKRNGLSNKFGD